MATKICQYNVTGVWKKCNSLPQEFADSTSMYNTAKEDGYSTISSEESFIEEWRRLLQQATIPLSA